LLAFGLVDQPETAQTVLVAQDRSPIVTVDREPALTAEPADDASGDVPNETAR